MIDGIHHIRKRNALFAWKLYTCPMSASAIPKKNVPLKVRSLPRKGKLGYLFFVIKPDR